MYFEDGTVAKLRYENNELVGGGAFEAIEPNEFNQLISESHGVPHDISNPDVSASEGSVVSESEPETQEREPRSGQSTAAKYSRSLKRRPSSSDILDEIRATSNNSTSIEQEDGTTTEIHMFDDESGESLLSIALDDDGLPVSKNEIKTIRFGTKAYDNAINVLAFSQKDESERTQVPESIEESINEIEDPSIGRQKILDTEEDLQRIGDLLASNEKKVDIATKLGVTRGTLDNYIENNKEKLASAFVERENKRTAAEESSGERGRPHVLTANERKEIFKALHDNDPAVRKSAQELSNEKKVHLNTINNAKHDIENKIYRAFHETNIDSEEAIEKFAREYDVDELVIENVISQDRAIIEDDDTIGDQTTSGFLGPDNNNNGIPSAIENNVAENVEQVESILIPDGTRMPLERRTSEEITEDFTNQVVGSQPLEPGESFVSQETIDFDSEFKPLSRMERGRYEEYKLRSSGDFPSMPLSDTEQALYEEYVLRMTVKSGDDVRTLDKNEDRDMPEESTKKSFTQEEGDNEIDVEQVEAPRQNINGDTYNEEFSEPVQRASDIDAQEEINKKNPKQY